MSQVQESVMNENSIPSRQERSGAFSPRYKSPILASVLSCVPGLGQIYIGYYAVGFIHAAVVVSLIGLSATNVFGDASPILGLGALFFMLYNIIDAGRRAAFYNLRVQGMDDLPLPGDLPTAGSGGSGLFGVILVVVGVIALTNTAFGLSLSWVEDWWPVAPIGVGAYLLVKSMAEKQAQAK